MERFIDGQIHKWRKESESSVTLRKKKDLRIVQKDIEGQYTLWEVSPKRKFTVAARFGQGLQGTTDAQKKGTLEELVGGSIRMYVLAGQETNKPDFCFINDYSLQTLDEIRNNVQIALNSTNTIPFIQDEELGTLFIPVSSQAQEKFKTSIHVGPIFDQHRDLVIFPLCLRQLVGRPNILKSAEFFDLDRKLKYGDIGHINQHTFMSFLSRDITPEVAHILSRLDIHSIDMIPPREGTPIIELWLEAIHRIAPLSYAEYQQASTLLAQTISKHELRQIFETQSVSLGNNFIGVTPGILDGHSVDNNILVSPHDEEKTENYNAIIQNYTSETGVVAPKAALLYRNRYMDSLGQEQYFLVVGGYHREIREYVKVLTQKYKQKYIELAEIAELDGILYFDAPKVSKSTSTSTAKEVIPMGMQIKFTKIKDHALYRTDHEQVLRVLNQFKSDPQAAIKVGISEQLEDNEAKRND